MTTDEAIITNGHAKGRVVPPLPELTFSTGITVQIRPLALLTLQAIGAAVRRHPDFAPPQPPTQTVEAIDGPTLVSNPDNPAHLAELKTHETRVGQEIARRTMRLIARRAVELEVDHAWVEQFRADMEAAESPVDGDDKEVYLYHYAAATPEDVAALQVAVLRRSQPTEAAVAEHTEAFPGDVSGA